MGSRATDIGIAEAEPQAGTCRVADYVARFVSDCGVRSVFMLSGTGSIHLDDAFARHTDLRYVCARHEAAAALMACGAAKATRCLGVVVVTTGPGGINAIAGIAEAWVDAVPVLVISGQVSRQEMADTRHFGIQGFDIVRAVQRFTNYAALVEAPETIRYHLERALHAATKGRPGPAWIDVPADIQTARIEPAGLPRFTADADHRPRQAQGQATESLVRVLRSAKRPLIVMGQGVRQAGALDAFRRLAERIGAPVAASRLAADAIQYSTPWYMGQVGVRGRRHSALILRRCDLLVGLGCSLGASVVGEQRRWLSPDATVAMVDLDPAELHKPGLAPDIPLAADVAEVIEGLSERLEQVELPDWSPWMAQCHGWKQELPTVTASRPGTPINTYDFVEQLQMHTDAKHVFVSDAGGAYYATGQALCFEAGERELTSGAFASMGVALPLGIGAAAADRDCRVLVITGDGSIETNIQELRTLAEHDLDVKVFVLNNGGYASIRDSQDALCGGLYTDVEEVLDFRKVADAFDLEYRLLEHGESLAGELREIVAQRGPLLVEVLCDPHQEMLRPVDAPGERP